MLANVYEHIFPERRVASFREIDRVLGEDGIVVGQIPNPYFPIESHSRLPFMGWLPMRLQKAYWRSDPGGMGARFLRRHAQAPEARCDDRGPRPVLVRKFNYPPEVIPKAAAQNRAGARAADEGHALGLAVRSEARAITSLKACS